MSETITLHRCVCGWLTVGGSIHGCVRCLRRTPPTPFEVVPVAEIAQFIEHFTGSLWPPAMNACAANMHEAFVTQYVMRDG